MGKRGGSANRELGREAIDPQDWEPEFDVTALRGDRRLLGWDYVDDLLADLHQGPQTSTSSEVALADQIEALQGEISDYLNDFPPETETTLTPEAELLQAELAAIEAYEAVPPEDDFPLSFLDAMNQLPLQDIQASLESSLSGGLTVEDRWLLDPLQVAIVPTQQRDSMSLYDWSGPVELQPPFSPDEFIVGFATSEPFGPGEHAIRDARIGGNHYLISIVGEADTLPSNGFTIRGSEHMARVVNAARYEASMRSAAYQIAQELQVGGSDDGIPPVARSYTFERDGSKYEVTEFLDRATALEVAIPLRPAELPQQSMEEMYRSQLQRLVLYDYLLGDPSRDSTKYLMDPLSGEVFGTDYKNAGRYDGDGMFVSTALELLIDRVGSVDNALLPRPLMREYVSHEAGVLRVMDQHRLLEGIPGMQKRFQHLHDLLGRDNSGRRLTMKDLGLIEHRQHHTSTQRLLRDFQDNLTRLQHIVDPGNSGMS